MVFHHESESGAWLISTKWASAARAADAAPNPVANVNAVTRILSVALPLQSLIVSTFSRSVVIEGSGWRAAFHPLTAGMWSPLHHRSRPRLGHLRKRCNGNFMKNKNGKYVPFDGGADYNRQRQEEVWAGFESVCRNEIKHPRESHGGREHRRIAERRRIDAAHRGKLRSVAASVEERGHLYRATSFERDGGPHQRHRRELRRASVRRGAGRAALRLFRLFRSAGGISSGLHGAGHVVAELSAEDSQADRREARRIVRRLGGARIHRGLARRSRGTRSGTRRQAVRRRRENAATGRQHLRGRRAPLVSGGELHRLRIAAHTQACASGVRIRRHVPRTDSQREEGRRGDRDQLCAIWQGNAVLPARGAPPSGE